MSTPSLPPVATVVSILDVPATEPNRAGQMNALITYRVDPLHSFTIIMTADDAKSSAKVDAAIRQDYAKRKEFINRQVSL